MKKTILLLFICIQFSGIAQLSGTFSIDWKNYSALSATSVLFKTPRFQEDHFYFDAQKKAIFFISNTIYKDNVDENSIQISNIVYENISKNDLGDLNLESIPSKLEAVMHQTKARNETKISFSVTPIIKEGDFFKKLIAFDYSVSNKTITKRSVLDIDNRRDFNNRTNSVLAAGDFYRFYIEKSGVYKLSKDFLKQLGLNVDQIDPRSIRLYGNGGRMIPLKNAIDYPADLTENAIQVIGENDGVFDNEDYVLFYGEGVDNWSQENETHLNLYADRSYYYITASADFGKRVQPIVQPNNAATTIFNNFDEVQFYEKDKINLARLGRKWFGEDFSIEDTQSFDFEIPNPTSGSTVKIKVNAGAIAYIGTKFDISANGSIVGSLSLPKTDAISSSKATENLFLGNFSATEKIKIELKYDNAGVPSAKGYLDYIELQSKRNLIGYGKQFRFQCNAAATLFGVGEYQISNAATITQIWDITDIYNVESVENSAGTSFSYKANLGEIRQYIALDNNDFLLPNKEKQTKIANQDLKGTIFENAQGESQDVDYLIITPSFLHTQAEKLASFHRSYSNLKVEVVDLENIYQEFSSGKQDIGAIRNFVKYVYRNASSEDKKVKYVNLFGDASFDFKNRIQNNTNIVPIFHSIDSFSLSSTYISDDFFVLMDDNEGDMEPTTSEGLDIAVGRMPVLDAIQAEEMIAKIIRYHDIKSFGRWRNNFVLISDDVDKNGEESLEIGLNKLGDELFDKKPFINVKKIHSDSYVQETAAGGDRYPKVREDFVNAFEQGALVFNYFGHGGEDGLAHERILEKSDAQNLTNEYKMPLFVTITCEFTRFDNPFRPTAGEYMYWNPKGGAISLITTTREIGLSTGLSINNILSKQLFGFNTNETISMAEALRRTKNLYPYNPEMVFYIGDPALVLAIPNPKIVLTKINNIPISEPVDSLKALSNIKISGEIRDENGTNLMGNYSGDLAVTIFDKPIIRQTLGNDGTTNGDNDLITLSFSNLGETIFRGNATILNGLFEFNFVVPRDIRVPVGNGRISFYAKKTNELSNQTGFDTSIIVGGINENAVADDVPPKVKLFMNDQTFVSGGITNESPFLLAFLEDQNGINTASGIGHDIIAVLDGDVNKPIVMNDYYETEPNDYTKGKLKFPFRNLTLGLHTLSFKAWDVYNNPVMSEIQFLVVGNEDITLTNVLNYPNPFVNYTQFWFTHNHPFEPLEVQVQVMTVTGKIVFTKNQIINTDGFLSREISWDGTDDFGDKIGKGVYVYKLTVKSTFTNKKVEKYEKLVIL